MVIQDEVCVGASFLGLTSLPIQGGFYVLADLSVAPLEVPLFLGNDIVYLFGVLHDLPFLVLRCVVLGLFPIDHLLKEALVSLLVGFLDLAVNNLLLLFHLLPVLLFQRYTKFLHTEFGLFGQVLGWVLLSDKEALKDASVVSRRQRSRVGFVYFFNGPFPVVLAVPAATVGVLLGLGLEWARIQLL